MAHQSDSILGFKHRLANYFERISGDVSHLKGVIDTLPKSYSTPEAQDTLMRFISDRCGIEEAEAVEELDYVTARLERERRNERFERLLEPWTTEQLEVSLRRYFGENDQSQLPTVSALVTFYRGREITLIRELELQYRRPLLLYREDEDDVRDQDGEVAGAMMEIANGIVTDGTQPADERDDDDDLEDEHEHDASSDGHKNSSGSSLNKLGRKGSAEDFAKKAAKTLLNDDDDSDDGTSPTGGNVAPGTKKKSKGGADGKKGGATSSSGDGNNNSSTANTAGTEALRIRTNFDEITVDSMQLFEKEILKFLLDIRQELHDRIRESELLAQQYAAAASSSSGSVGNNNNNAESGEGETSPSKRRSFRKSSMLKRRLMMASQMHQSNNNNNTNEQPELAASINTDGSTEQQQQQQQQTNPSTGTDGDDDAIAKSVVELTKELSALPRKRLARVERMMQIIPLIARAVTPVYKSQLFLYLGFYCSLRIEARKVMQKRIAGALHDAPMKADENFQRRSAAIFSSEKDSRESIMVHERRMWARMDPMFFRERFLRMQGMLFDEEQSTREEIKFDELCISSVARAKLRSLLFIERSYTELNSFV